MSSSVVVIGSYVQDLTFSIPVFPKPGQTLIGNFKTGPGGKGSNQAVASARTGVSTSFVGATGDDAFAQVAKQFHKSENIDSHLIPYPDHATGTAAILVNDQGENEIVVALGANNFLRTETIPTNLFSEARILITQLESNLETLDYSLKLAKSSRVTTLLNPAPMRDDFPLEILEHVDILVPNETEFAHLTRMLHPNTHDDFDESAITETDPEELHRLARTFGVATFIITLGGSGCFVSTPNSHYKVPSLSGIEVVDTTGAGDAFVGGFASGLVQFQGDVQRATQYGNIVGGLSVTRFGTAPAMPYKTEIDQEMIKQNLA